MAKIMSINRVCLAETLCSVQKIHFLFNETKVSVVNWLKWHYKLQYLFCGALYNWQKCKKRAVPFNNFSFILVSRLKWKWSIRTCLLKFFIDEIMDNVCIMKWNKNIVYKKTIPFLINMALCHPFLHKNTLLCVWINQNWTGLNCVSFIEKPNCT